MALPPASAVSAPPTNADQRWPWWPLLPLYPYGRRPTLVRELIPEQLWSFEQLQGVFYVAVPIRMTVARVRGGLMLYAPVAPTAQVRRALLDLEQRYGPVQSIVLPTASGLEHKLPVPAMARAYPEATVWVTPGQWSFPLNLPASWLGFPRRRTRVLGDQGYPHSDALQWLSLGPLDLGLGRFQEFSCLHRSTGALLITDALVAINPQPPELFDADPTPLLFHARDRGDQPLTDSPELRLKGWQRLALFASYLRPEALSVPPLPQLLAQAFRPGCRDARSYFGLYPFHWSRSSAAVFAELQGQAVGGLQVAPVLERLVFPRAQALLLAWLRRLAELPELRWLVPAHYDAPVPCTGEQLLQLAQALEQRAWAPSQGDWTYLAGIDGLLLRSGVVPEQPLS
ncbi:MAG: hypothetical protein RLZZ346_133 [Cyanobacteriota bacterium]|jgi:hypothetical protein